MNFKYLYAPFFFIKDKIFAAIAIIGNNLINQDQYQINA